MLNIQQIKKKTFTSLELRKYFSLYTIHTKLSMSVSDICEPSQVLSRTIFQLFKCNTLLTLRTQTELRIYSPNCWKLLYCSVIYVLRFSTSTCIETLKHLLLTRNLQPYCLRKRPFRQDFLLSRRKRKYVGKREMRMFSTFN